MAKNNYYAVARGRQLGIYQEWYGPGGAEVQVKGFPGARYKGFATRQEADAWLRQMQGSAASEPVMVAHKPPPRLAARGPRLDRQESGEDRVTIYTDGGCLTNPGRGGFAAVVLRNGERKELSGGYRWTTNNRMELTACIKGLEALAQKSTVVVYCDSQYVVNGMTKGWARRWRSRGWMRNEVDPAENPDLWAQLLSLCEFHQVEFRWVKGHAGNPENERCDQLSAVAAKQTNLLVDEGYQP